VNAAKTLFLTRDSQADGRFGLRPDIRDRSPSSIMAAPGVGIHALKG
jgi:hypothetical protein